MIQSLVLLMLLWVMLMCIIRVVIQSFTGVGTVLKVAMGYISGSVFSVIYEEIKVQHV